MSMPNFMLLSHLEQSLIAWTTIASSETPATWDCFPLATMQNIGVGDLPFFTAFHQLDSSGLLVCYKGHIYGAKTSEILSVAICVRFTPYLS